MKKRDHWNEKKKMGESQEGYERRMERRAKLDALRAKGRSIRRGEREFILLELPRRVQPNERTGGAMKGLLVSVYLAAIVAANLSVTHWGPKAAIYNAFLFIGLDLTCRDRLHDLWRGSHLLMHMAALIVAGSALSYLVNRDTARIALASCIAFGLAATADGIVYHLLRNHSWYERVNQSNLAGASVDSIDGTMFSMFRKRWLPYALSMNASGRQLAL